MFTLNKAQQIYVFLGVDRMKLLLGHYKELSDSHTKKGPGRKHLQGKKKVSK